MYPYRALVKAKLDAGDTRFVQHEHPGYLAHYDASKDYGVGASYGCLLSRHLAAIVDGLFLNYTVAKVCSGLIVCSTLSRPLPRLAAEVRSCT